MSGLARRITIGVCAIVFSATTAVAAEMKPADPMDELVKTVDTIIMAPIKIIDDLMK